MKQKGYYVGIPDLNSGLEKDMNQLFGWINRWTDALITVTVAVAGTEVEVSHGLGKIPSAVLQVASEVADGQGVIYKGTTAWNENKLYLTATAAGVYSIIARR